MTALFAFLTRVLRSLFAAWLARPDPVAASAHDAGVAQADLAVTRGALEAQWRVSEAARTAPKTDAEIDDLLDKGEA